MKRSPKCLSLQRVQPAKGTYVDYDKWDQVKVDVLQGAITCSPGCLVAYTRLGVAVQHFKRAGSMKVTYTFDKNAKMFLVHKEEWSWAELLDIATESVYFSSNKFWMLPNRAKILSNIDRI